MATTEAVIRSGAGCRRGLCVRPRVCRSRSRWADQVHADRAPVFGESVGVIDVNVKRTWAGRGLLAVCEMDRQVVAVREGVVLVVVGDREAEQLIVADRSLDVGDLEARLVANDANGAAGLVSRRRVSSATKRQ